MSDFTCLMILGSLAWSIGMIVLMFLVEHRLTRIQRMMEDEMKRRMQPPQKARIDVRA